MDAAATRQDPWTCRWARFGVAVEPVGSGGARVDDVFWACHHPIHAPELRLMKRGECERCPLWERPPRLCPAC